MRLKRAVNIAEEEISEKQMQQEEEEEEEEAKPLSFSVHGAFIRNFADYF